MFLPPIGGLTIYIFGDPALIPDEDVPLTVRVHDECNGSDVFGRYDIKTMSREDLSKPCLGRRTNLLFNQVFCWGGL